MRRLSLPLALSISLAAPLTLLAQDAGVANPSVETALPAITVVTVAETVLRDRIIASGLMQPVETVLVQPQIEGQAIEAVLAEVGDSVVAGQVLARLSDSALTLQKSQLVASRASAVAAIAQARAQVAEAEASRDEAVRVSERSLQLREQGAVSQAATDQAVAAAATAEARVNAAQQALVSAEAQIDLVDAQIADVELNLNRTNIAAPVDGVIVERSARIGAIASAVGGTPLFSLIRDGALELRADVAEADLLRLAPGQAAQLHVVGQRLPVTGSVRLVEPSVDTQTRLGRVRIALDDSSVVRDGMFAEASILVAEREGLAVPVTAVGSRGNALKVVDGVVDRVPVETGIRDGGLVEITSGLAPGDTIVARAGAFVRDGDRINPVPVDAATN